MSNITSYLFAIESYLLVSECVLLSCVQVTKFLLDDLHAVSGSDDKSVRSWDIATGECLAVFNEHQVKLLEFVSSFPASPTLEKYLPQSLSFIEGRMRKWWMVL